jgi:hypothetical protein
MSESETPYEPVLVLRTDEYRRWVRCINAEGDAVELGILVTPEGVSIDLWDSGGQTLISESFILWSDYRNKE